MGVIYILTFPNGKQYIGQTRHTIEKRFREHVYDSYDPQKNHCKLLNKAICKYGEKQVEKKVLVETDIERLNAYEEYFIQLFGTMKPNGYNLKPGGSVCQHTEETKLKIAQSLVGRRKSVESLERRSRTKKTAKHLPMYIITYNNTRTHEHQGYRVTHPSFKEKRFSLNNCHDAKTDDDVLKCAIEYLNNLYALDKVQRLNSDG